MKQTPSASAADSPGTDTRKPAEEGVEPHLSKSVVVVSNPVETAVEEVEGPGVDSNSINTALRSSVGSADGGNRQGESSQSRSRSDNGTSRERSYTSLSMIRKVSTNNASLLNTPLAGFDDGDEGGQLQAERRKTRSLTLRNDAAFWCLGLINNSSYVIMMAVAKDIAPAAVGVVFLADVAPTMLVKLSAPYW